jgi:hypothetical protein
LESSFWILVVAASYQLNFYWTVTSVSFCITRAYYISLLWLSSRGASTQHNGPFQRTGQAKWMAIAGWIIFVMAMIWCCSLTPLHVFTPTFMDIWTSLARHPPLRSFDVLHDPGEDAIIECELLKGLLQLLLTAHSVFAIHGLGSNTDNAWTYRNDSIEVRWLKDILPKVEGLEGIRVTVVNHQTRWDANSANMNLEEHAAMVLDDIESLRTVRILHTVNFT